MFSNPPVSSVCVNRPRSVSSQPAASAFTVQDKDGKVAGKVRILRMSRFVLYEQVGVEVMMNVRWRCRRDEAAT